jgi:hypothetical protein
MRKGHLGRRVDVDDPRDADDLGYEKWIAP